MSKTSSQKTLGPVSASFINQLYAKGKIIFRLDEAVQVYARGRVETTKFLSTLTKRGILARIRPGVYLVLQMGQEHTQLNNWPLIAHELADSADNYFLSHYSAMRLHGITTHSLFDVYITMPARRVSKKINLLTYHFIYCKPKNFLGRCNYWVTKQNKIYVSDLERTLLDGLDRPDLCGGMKEVIRGVWIKRDVIDWQKMEKYAMRFSTRAVVKRLGFILELLNIAKDFRAVLTKVIISANDYILLDPNGIRQGQYVSRWRIRLNLNVQELKAGLWE